MPHQVGLLNRHDQHARDRGQPGAYREHRRDAADRYAERLRRLLIVLRRRMYRPRLVRVSASQVASSSAADIPATISLYPE